MDKLILIDGNSIANRAFYGIMATKMMTSKEGTCTNAIYGFLSILFKIIEDLEPKYLAVAFDLKAPTRRHIAYEGYKAGRKGMPDELREQMPILKEVLRKMNIDVIEKEGFEADDILGTLAKYGENKGLSVTVLSGDRDTFQLASDNITIRIPRTKAGKTEVEDFDRAKIEETYGVTPCQLIDVKGLQGDASDNIPGVPGIGEKTALSLIKKFGNIEEIYAAVHAGTSELKGKQKENIENNEELAMLSKSLGTIDLDVPLENNLETFKVEEWDKEEVLKIFEQLNFKKYIEKFALKGDVKKESIEEQAKYISCTLKELVDQVSKKEEFVFYINTKNEDDETKNAEKIIKEKIVSISAFFKETNTAVHAKVEESSDIEKLKKIFENKELKKASIEMGRVYILLKQIGIDFENIYYDIAIASYVLNPADNKLALERLVDKFLDESLEDRLKEVGGNDEAQINLFEENDNFEETQMQCDCVKVVYISKIKEITTKSMQEDQLVELFNNIEMPTVEVLANMQWNGILVNVEKLNEFGIELMETINRLMKEIHELAGEVFNINSPKQLGEVLFEKLKYTAVKKTKSGYSTDVEVLEKLKGEGPIIEKILEYRKCTKLNSTYVEGLKQYINPKTKRIHSFFHQTVTSTGRISSTEPNLQNIPVRTEQGKKIRETFFADSGHVYVDADYSQVELRVLAEIANDPLMIESFNNGEDIHKQAAAKVFKVEEAEVTSAQRSSAKAVNFGIVYGISEFGLAEQLGVTRKVAKEYIEEYLNQYTGIKSFMDNIVEETKEKGYVTTRFGRRRYVEELKSTNFNVRQFGARVAMNTPIQGTAADIMKIAMINVLEELKKRGLKSKLILQVHDEMLLEVVDEEKDTIGKLIKDEMEKVLVMKVPLIADVSVAKTWDECK